MFTLGYDSVLFMAQCKQFEAHMCQPAIINSGNWCGNQIEMRYQIDEDFIIENRTLIFRVGRIPVIRQFDLFCQW